MHWKIQVIKSQLNSHLLFKLFHLGSSFKIGAIYAVSIQEQSALPHILTFHYDSFLCQKKKYLSVDKRFFPISAFVRNSNNHFHCNNTDVSVESVIDKNMQ